MIGLSAITDEFSPDLTVALQGMSEIGMTGAELRVLSGRNIVDCSDEEIDNARAAIERAGMQIVALATPLNKCVPPGSPANDPRFAHDIFGSAYTFEDQPRLRERAFDVAERCGVRLIRTFTYWRSVEPERSVDRIVAMLRDLADRAAARHLVLGLENEHACNVGSGAETAAVLSAVDRPNVKVIWDPANATILGEAAYPAGYSAIPIDRIAHVHAKDCVVQNSVPTWGVVGKMGVGWAAQIAALKRDGYQGFISLETHWKGPNDDKYAASMICGRALSRLLAES